MAQLRSDDLKTGQYIIVTAHLDKPSQWDADGQMAYVASMDERPPLGIPFRVMAVQLPFVAIELPARECSCGRRHGPQVNALDTRAVTLAKCSTKYARSFDEDADADERDAFLTYTAEAHVTLVAELRKLFGITDPMPAEELMKRIRAKVTEGATPSRIVVP